MSNIIRDRNPVPSIGRGLRRAGVAAAVVVLACGLATVEAADLKGMPGYVDPAPFLALEDEEGELIEVSLPGTLLQAFAGPFRSHAPDLADVVMGLEWVGAVIVGTEDPDKLRAAKKLFETTEKRLLAQGWVRLVRVREGGSTFKVLILNVDSIVRGLVVMGRDDEELIFTNVAGTIDLEKLGALGRQMEIPGLEELGND